MRRLQIVQWPLVSRDPASAPRGIMIPRDPAPLRFLKDNPGSVACPGRENPVASWTHAGAGAIPSRCNSGP
jgi:hypothetical protein